MKEQLAFRGISEELKPDGNQKLFQEERRRQN
jgi:hypothetical protein